MKVAHNHVRDRGIHREMVAHLLEQGEHGLVEYYIIHDSVPSPVVKADERDDLCSTNDIIAKAQVILSHRSLVERDNHSKSRTGSHYTFRQQPRERPVDGDDFFVAFERRWAIEQPRWNI